MLRCLGDVAKWREFGAVRPSMSEQEYAKCDTALTILQKRAKAPLAKVCQWIACVDAVFTPKLGVRPGVLRFEVCRYRHTSRLNPSFPGSGQGSETDPRARCRRWLRGIRRSLSSPWHRSPNHRLCPPGEGPGRTCSQRRCISIVHACPGPSLAQETSSGVCLAQGTEPRRVPGSGRTRRASGGCASRCQKVRVQPLPHSFSPLGAP